MEERLSESMSEKEYSDSDEELQDAFAKGLLKPGLNVLVDPNEKKKKKYKNNVCMLQQKLDEMYLKLDWVERLDMVNKPSPLQPELADKIEEHEQKRIKALKGMKNGPDIKDDIIHNDFKQEMLFYRQAQSVVLEGISSLHAMNVPTARPEDYYAQMVKSDEHMQKIRKVLISKQLRTERSEKAKKLRELRKYGKKVQVETLQKRQQQKRELIEKVKKYRKGKIDNLDFLDELDSESTKKETSRKTQLFNKSSAKAQAHRIYKDKKYGFGGKKKGLKRNTKESAAGDFESKSKKQGAKQKGKQKRLGKNRRQKQKGRQGGQKQKGRQGRQKK